MPYVKPLHKILVGGDPIVEELVTEGTDVKPGLLAIPGTGDHQVKPAGLSAENVIGVVDYDAKRPLTEAYPNNYSVRILKGNIVVVLTLKSGNNVTKGTRLQSEANGMCKPLPNTENYQRLIGYAEESVDASTEDKPIMVRLVI